MLASWISYGQAKQEILKTFQEIPFEQLWCLVDIDRIDKPNWEPTKYLNESEMIFVDNLETSESKEIYIQYKNIHWDKAELHTYADGTIYQKWSVNEHTANNSTELSQIRDGICSKIEQILKTLPEEDDKLKRI